MNATGNSLNLDIVLTHNSPSMDRNSMQSTKSQANQTFAITTAYKPEPVNEPTLPTQRYD